MCLSSISRLPHSINSHWPQTRPSASIDRTAFSMATRSVSSSQGLTSRTIVLFAMTCSSKRTRFVRRSISFVWTLLLAFLAAYSASRFFVSSLSCSSSDPNRSMSSSSSFFAAVSFELDFWLEKSVKIVCRMTSQRTTLQTRPTETLSLSLSLLVENQCRTGSELGWLFSSRRTRCFRSSIISNILCWVCSIREIRSCSDCLFVAGFACRLFCIVCRSSVSCWLNLTCKNDRTDRCIGIESGFARVVLESGWGDQAGLNADSNRNLFLLFGIVFGFGLRKNNRLLFDADFVRRELTLNENDRWSNCATEKRLNEIQIARKTFVQLIQLRVLETSCWNGSSVQSSFGLSEERKTSVCHCATTLFLNSRVE